MHSSTRPQRGSRITSSTGARPWCTPSVRIDSPIRRAISSTSVGIERRPPGERSGEGRRLPCGQARQALLVDDRGDAEPGLRAEASLLAPQPRGALDGIDRAGAVHARQVADAVRASHLRTASRRRARRPSARPARRPDRPRSRPAGRSSPPASSARRARGRAPNRSMHPFAGSALHRSGQPADDASLEQAEEHQRRDHRQRREGEHLRGVDGVLRRERLRSQAGA